MPPELTLINEVKAEKNQSIGRRGLGLTLTLQPRRVGRKQVAVAHDRATRPLGMQTVITGGTALRSGAGSRRRTPFARTIRSFGLVVLRLCPNDPPNDDPTALSSFWQESLGQVSL
jgi:hypothetical protein